MDDYIKLLEKRNEELQELLAKSQTENIELSFYRKALVFKWLKVSVPVHPNSNENSAYIYRYDSAILTYAEIWYREIENDYIIRYHNKDQKDSKVSSESISVIQGLVEQQCNHFFHDLKIKFSLLDSYTRQFHDINIV